MAFLARLWRRIFPSTREAAQYRQIRRHFHPERVRDI